MKKGWGRYASEKRYIQKGYLRKHCDGGSGRKTYETSRCNCVQQSRQVEEEKIEDPLQWYGKIVQMTEEPIVYIVDNNESDRIDQDNGRKGRSRKCDRVEEDNSGSVASMQSVSGSKPKCSRKTRNIKADG